MANKNQSRDENALFITEKTPGELLQEIREWKKKYNILNDHFGRMNNFLERIEHTINSYNEYKYRHGMEKRPNEKRR